MTMSIAPDARVTHMSDADAARRFEELCQNHMRLSTVDFLTKWDRGDFKDADWDEIPGLRRVAMALPMVRP